MAFTTSHLIVETLEKAHDERRALATGIGWGLQYGTLAGRASRHPILRGLALGPVVWLTGYVVLPLAGVYQPIWKYDARTLAKDLSAHVLYGAITSAAFAALTRTPQEGS